MENEEEGDDEDGSLLEIEIPEHLEQLKIQKLQTRRGGFDDGFNSFSLAILRSSFGLDSAVAATRR